MEGSCYEDLVRRICYEDLVMICYGSCYEDKVRLVIEDICL